MNTLIEKARTNAEEWKSFDWNKQSWEKANRALCDGEQREMLDAKLRQEADWASEVAPKLGVDLDKEDHERKRNEVLDVVEAGCDFTEEIPDRAAMFDNRCRREGAYEEFSQQDSNTQARHLADSIVALELGQTDILFWSSRKSLYDKYKVKNDEGLVEVYKQMVADRRKMRGSWERAYDGLVKGVAKSGDVEASLAGVKAQGGDQMDYEAALEIGVNRGKLFYLQEAQQKLKPIMDKMAAKQKEEEENPMGTPILDKEDWLKVGGAQDQLVELLYAHKDDKERFTALMDLLPEMMPDDKRFFSQQFTQDMATSFKGAAEVVAGKDNKYVAIRRAAMEAARSKREVPTSWVGRGVRSAFDQAAQMAPIVATGMAVSAASGGNVVAGMAAGAAVGTAVYGSGSIMNAYADGGSKWASIGYGAGIGAIQGAGDVVLAGVGGVIGKVGKTAVGASLRSGAQAVGKSVAKSGIGRAGGVVARAVTADSAGSAAGFYARKMAWNGAKSLGFEHVQENGEDMTGVLLENTMRKYGAQLPVQQTYGDVWEQNSFKNPEYAVPLILLGGGMGLSGGMRQAFFADRASRSAEILKAHGTHPMIAKEISDMPDGPDRDKLLSEVDAKVDLSKAREALPAAFALTADNLNFLRENSRIADLRDNGDGTFSYTDAFSGQAETFDKGMFPSIMEGFMRSEEGRAIMTAQLYARGKEVAEYEGFKWQVVDQGVLDQYMRVGSEVAKNRTLAYIASDPELSAKYERGEVTVDDVMKELEVIAVTDKGVIQIVEGKANFAEIAEELCHARVGFDTKVGKVSDEFIIQGLKDWEEFTGESVGDVTDYVQRNEAVARLAVAAATDPSVLNKLPPRMNGFIVWLKGIIAEIGRVFQTGEKLKQGVKSGAISEEFYSQLKEWGALESRKVEQGVVESVTGESYGEHLAALRTKGRASDFSSYDDSGLFDASNFPKDHKLGHDEWVKNGRLLAPNGKPSNLTADEYAMVYSPEFKKENGDWEGFSKGEFLRGEPIAELSGDEFAKSADDSRPLSVKVADFYNENGVDSVHVPGLGDVDLGLNTIENALNHWMNRQKASAFAAVPNVLAKGVHLDSRVQTGNNNLVSHVFAAPVKINGENYVEVVRIRQAKGQAGKFYLHGVQLLEKLENKKSSETIIDQSKHKAGLTGGPEDIFNLVKGALAVNKNDVHVDLDANGEPSLSGEVPLAALRKRGDGSFFSAIVNTKEEDFVVSASKAYEGNLHNRRRVYVSETPRILQKLGAKDLPLKTSAAIIRKLRDNHYLSLKNIEELRDSIANPIAVFKSKKDGSFVVITDEKAPNESGDVKNIMVAIALSERTNDYDVNFMTSAYARNHSSDYGSWIDNGLLIYADTKRAQVWFKEEGLQLPTLKPLQGDSRSEVKILTPDDIVKMDSESSLAAIRRRKFNETSKGLDESPRYSTYKSMIQAAAEKNPTKVFEAMAKSLSDLEGADQGSAKALNRKKDVILTIDRTLRVLGDDGLSKSEGNRIIQAKDNAALGRALDVANLRLSVALSEARANAEAADLEARLVEVHEKQIKWERDQDNRERKEYSATWRKLLVAKERDDLKEKRRERKEARELTAREKADEKAREDAIKKQQKADVAELKKNIGKMGELATSVYNGRKQRSRTFDADTRRLGMYAETLMDMNPDDVAAMKEDLNGRFAELEKEGDADPVVKEEMDALRVELAMVEEYGGVLYKEKGENGRWKYVATPEAIKNAQKSLIELLEVGRVRWAVAEMQRLEPIRQMKAGLHEAAGGDRTPSQKQQMKRDLAKKGYRSLWKPICNFLQSPIQFLDTYVESKKFVPEGLRNFARALREIVADAANMTAEAEKAMKERVGNVLKGAMEIDGKKGSIRNGAKYVNDLEVANIEFAGATYSKGALIDMYMTSMEKDGVSTIEASNGITADQLEILPELIGEDGVYLATELFKIYKEIGVDVKAVYEARSGHPLFVGENYVPRDRDYSKMSRDESLGVESGQSAIGKPNALKDRTKSKAALIFSDSPIKKLLKHSSRMNSYMARAELIDIYNNVLRDKTASFDLRVMMGEQDFNALKKGVENMLLDGNKLAQEAELISRFGNFMNVFAKSALGYSINPIIRNAAALVNPLLGTDFTSGEIAKALADLNGGRADGFTFKDVLEVPSIKVRFNNDLKTEALYKMAAKVEFKQASSLSFYSDFGMVGIEKTDLWVTTASTWLAAQILRKRGLSKEMIIKELNLNVLRSSQPMRVETKPMGMAGMSRIASNNFLFMSDVMNKAGLFTSYWQQGKYGMSAATYLTVGLVNMATSEAISALFGSDDEPDMTPEGIAASIVLAPLLNSPFTSGVAELVMKKAGVPVWASGNKIVDTSKAVQKIASVFEKATDDKEHDGESWGNDMIGLAKALSVPAGGMLSAANRAERAVEVATLIAQGSNAARGLMRGGHRLQSATGTLSELGKKEQDYSKEKKAVKEAVTQYGKGSPQARVAQRKANLMKRQVDAMKKQK